MKAEIDFEQCVKLIRDNISNVGVIYLFGSYAAGQQNSSSDVDLAFLTYTKVDNIQRWKLQERVASLLESDVDLVDLEKSSLVLQHQVISEGKPIFINKVSELEQYESKTSFLYLDLCELRQPIIENIQESGSFYR